MILIYLDNFPQLNINPIPIPVGLALPLFFFGGGEVTTLVPIAIQGGVFVASTRGEGGGGGRCGINPPPSHNRGRVNKLERKKIVSTSTFPILKKKTFFYQIYNLKK